MKWRNYTIATLYSLGGKAETQNTHCVEPLQSAAVHASSLVTTGTVHHTALNTFPQSHLPIHGPLASTVNYSKRVCMTEINLSAFCVFTATT